MMSQTLAESEREDRMTVESNARSAVAPELLPSVGVDDFKAAFRGYPAGVCVITAEGPQGPVGLTATSVASVSVDPPLLIFSLSALSSSTPTLKSATTIIVHILGKDQLEIARLCATSGIDRFADTSLWSRTEDGEPYFHGVEYRIRAHQVESIETGQSTIIVARALEVWADGDAGSAPLVYHNRTWHSLGAHSEI
ncbi:MAG: flavin reductase family protein [Pseudolysinimonas sp.]